MLHNNRINVPFIIKNKLKLNKMTTTDRGLIKKANQLDFNSWHEVNGLIELTDDREVLEALFLIRRVLKARLKKEYNKNNS